MIARILLITLIAITLAQVPSCHYYIRAMPDFIISSEPFTPPPPEAEWTK